MRALLMFDRCVDKVVCPSVGSKSAMHGAMLPATICPLAYEEFRNIVHKIRPNAGDNITRHIGQIR